MSAFGPRPISERDRMLLGAAVALAARCPPVDTAFAVGALIADAAGNLLATGYSRAFGDHWHAEEVALENLRRAGRSAVGAEMFVSMEPCGRRLSGRRPCAELIAAAGISRVVYCVAEPPVFVGAATGAAVLRAAGVTVVHDPTLAAAALAPNHHLIGR